MILSSVKLHTSTMCRKFRIVVSSVFSSLNFSPVKLRSDAISYSAPPSPDRSVQTSSASGALVALLPASAAFHRPVRQVELLLQVVDAQRGLNRKLRRPPLGPDAGACEAIRGTNLAHGTTGFTSSRNSRLRILLVLRSYPLSPRPI